MGRLPKILVVDDELRVCESLAYLLKTKGYEVMTANCGHDAMGLLADESYDLAILDVHLPDMMGTAIMDHVKMNSPDTVVIIITADANLDSALAALKCGAYDYLRKPFEFEELLNTVANALNQKALKLETEKINEKLYLSEKKYRYLVEKIPDIIYTLDAHGHFTFLSEAVEHLLGFNAENMIGKHYTAIVWEEDQDKAQWFFDERRSRDRASAGIELRLKVIGDALPKNDGLPFLAVELKSMGIYEETARHGERQYVGTHGVIRDISGRKRLEAQLQSADRMESLGTLAGGIAHDFNNLLMGIQGRTSLLSMDLEGSANMEHLQAIDQYIHSATELTKQLLGFARGGKYEVKPTDMNELVLKSANMFGRTKKEIVIQTKFHNANIVVEVDRGQIEQVLLNLYVNAWQAMPDGGTLRLETECVDLGEKFCRPYQLPKGRYVHVAVTDTGIGMDAKTLQRIFDPFFTTKEKGRGTGLGLASAYGIIKNHGGIIDARSEIGYGTTFDIYLPLCAESVANQLSSEEIIENGSETILLVDDEDMIIEVGQALLRRLGYQVIAAKSGKEAIDIVHHSSSHIDLVILDMVMPGLDGGRTFDSIRGIRPDMPVMLCSGYAINERADKIMRKGCNGFIQKPFNASKISRRIRRVLDEARSTI
jgi:two-component system, cell cycle sensor histidine kinase and response regulator CckA